MRKQSHKWSLYAPLGDGKEGNLRPWLLPRETWVVSSIHIIVSGFSVGWVGWMQAFKSQQCCWKLWWGFNESHRVTPFPRTLVSTSEINLFFFFFQKSFQLMPGRNLCSSKLEHLMKSRVYVTLRKGDWRSQNLKQHRQGGHQRQCRCVTRGMQLTEYLSTHSNPCCSQELPQVPPEAMNPLEMLVPISTYMQHGRSGSVEAAAFCSILHWLFVTSLLPVPFWLN